MKTLIVMVKLEVQVQDTKNQHEVLEAIEEVFEQNILEETLDFRFKVIEDDESEEEVEEEYEEEE